MPDYSTKESVYKRGEELAKARIPFGVLDVHNRLSQKNKGDLGQIVEESWYHYNPNSTPEPDFQEAGVELKVAGYLKNINGVTSKERLVCNIINYMEEYDKTFETSAFWRKCKCLLLLSYFYNRDVTKAEMFVDHATLIDEYPIEDMLIIKHDWDTIIQKIRDGEAHLLSEGDTMYLGAATKGSGSGTFRQQPFNTIPAKQRAYALKQSYMTRLLRKFVFGEEEDEHIIKDWHQLETASFDEIILRMFDAYIGKTSEELAHQFGLEYSLTKKGMNASIIRKILGITGDPDRAEEFRNANITVKTVVINKKGMPEQHMSFPTFQFNDIIHQEWEDSDVYNQMVASRLLLVVFQRDNKKQVPTLIKVKFWNLPAEDIEEVHTVWNKAIEEILKGAGLVYDGKEVHNTLPKPSQSRVAHVRPHSTLAAYILADGTIIGNPKKYANPLPNGEWMTTQCFWFNMGYIKKVLEED